MKTLGKNRLTKSLLGVMLSIAMLTTLAYSIPVYAAEGNEWQVLDIFKNEIVPYGNLVEERGTVYSYNTALAPEFSTGSDNKLTVGMRCQSHSGATTITVRVEKKTILGFIKEKEQTYNVSELYDSPAFPLNGHIVDQNTTYRIFYRTNTGTVNLLATHQTFK